MSKFKKIKILNTKDRSRNIFTKFKSPIRDFIINNDSNFRLKLFSNYKANKIKNSKLFNFNPSKKKHKNNSYFGKELMNTPHNLELTEGKGEENQTKNKIDTGIKVNNLFLLGDKYYTINKLRKQIKNFNSLENNKKTVEVIQSNRLKNDEDKKSNVLSDIKNENKKIGKLGTYDVRKLKRNFVKFSQEFNNFHLSFVPISAGSDNIPSNNNSIIDDNNFSSYNNIFKNKNYSTFGEKLYQNKSNKNYFYMTKKNILYKKKYLNRNNSDSTQLQEKLLEIQSEYINFRKKLK
jgi:hypothetical protein